MAKTIDPDEISSKDVAKGAGTTLLARLGSVIDVIAQPLYVFLFGLPSFGLYAAMWAAVNLIENIADLGMTSALQRTVPQAKTEKEAAASLRAAMILGVGPCFIIAALVSLFAPHLTHVFNTAQSDQVRLAHGIAVFVWTLPLWAGVEIMTSALRARRVFGAEVRLRLFWEQVARMVFAIAFWAAGFGTMSLLYAHIASLFIIFLLCIRLAGQHYDLRLLRQGPLIDDMWRDTVKAGLSVLPTNIVARIFGDAPTVVLNILLPGAAGASASGLFSISRKISSIVQLVRTAFAYVLAPLASLASTGATGRVHGIYGFATRVSFSIALPMGVVLCASGPAILRVFGPEAAAALPALMILIAARIVEAVIGSAVPIQQVTGGYRGQFLGSGLGLALAAALAIWLVPISGLTGMTIAVGAGLVVAAVVPLWQLHRYHDIHPFQAPFARVAMRAVTVAAAGLLAALPIYWLPNAAQLPLLALLLVGTLWSGCRFALPREDREALGKTGKKLGLS